MNDLSSRLYSVLSKPSMRADMHSTSLHASSASVQVPSPEGGTKTIGACLREQYYRVMNTPVPFSINEDWDMAAKIGEYLHRLLSDLVDQHGFAMELQRLSVEHRFKDPRIGIVGRSDMILWDYRNQQPIGVEIKSVGEWKAKNVILYPDFTHIMQAMLYLDYYRSSIPVGQIRPTRWYIWYISRVETYAIKNKKHGSPFTGLWDSYITLDGDIPIVHSSAGVTPFPQLHLQAIKDRFGELNNYINQQKLPPRDYQLVYPEERIASLYKLDLLERKADREAVEKWLKKGAPAGKLGVEMGDFECKACTYKDKCWDLETSILQSNAHFNLPSVSKPTLEIVPEQEDLLVL